MDSDFSFEFKTPTVRVVDVLPKLDYKSSAQSLNPLFFVAFDQKIDPEQAISQVKAHIMIDRNTTREYSAMTLVDLSKESIVDPEIKRATEIYQPGYWFAFRSATKYPNNAVLIIAIGPSVNH